jgi:hypothetical protein
VAHLARRLLAMVSIAGGGLLGAAPSAFATPDPTPSTSQTASTPASPTPPPPVTLPLRTGRAVPAEPDAPAAGDPPDLGAAATLRTGLATELAPPSASTPAPPVSAPVPAPPAIPPPPSPSPNAHLPASSSSSTRAGDPITPASSAEPTAAGPPPDPNSYTVVAGDSLWSIAAAQVAEHVGQSPASLAAADVTPYWQAVCVANRSTLRSGDLNLIFVGEQITLPPMAS